MTDKLNDLWNRAAEGETVDIGELVFCDFCDQEYTDSHESGGFIFGSKAVCPICEWRIKKTIKQYNEEHFIEAQCPHGQSFADFIRAYRGKNTTIKITKINSNDVK